MSIDESSERISRLDWTNGQRIDLLNLCRKESFPLFSLGLSVQRKWPLGSADASTRKRSFEFLEKAIQLAVDLNIRIIQILGYWVYYEEINTDSEKRFLEGLRRGVEVAEKYGVMLGIENIDGYDNVNCIRKAMDYVRSIDSPWLKLYSDFANLAAFGFDIEEEIKAGKNNFVAFHVKDAKPQEVRRIPFGEGIVDFDTAFNTLADIGYNGPFLLEMWNDDSPRSEERITDAFNKLKECIRDSRYCK
jgi:L-ribulose-5-phosphate 3-epimerase